MTEHHNVPEEHSDIVGGSTAARRLGCTASYRLEQLVPKDTGSSVYAREGTALHELMSTILLKGIDNPISLLPFTFTTDKDGGWTFDVTEKLWEEKGAPALKAFDEYCAAIEAEAGEDMQLLIERRVQLAGIAGAFGTADIIGRCGDEIFVMDWKFGFKPVDVTDNKQLQFYAAGAINTEREWTGELSPETPVTVVIIQPLNAMAGKEILNEWSTTVGALAAYEADLAEAVAIAQTDDGECKKGHWCDFARCKTVCPLHLNAVGALGDMLRKLGEDQAASNGSPDDRIEWGERYSELLDLADLVDPLVASIHAQAHAYAETGGVIPNYGLEAKRAGGRTWAVEDRLLSYFFKRNKVKVAEYTERKILSLPAAEKMLKARGVAIPEKYIQKGVSSGTKLSRSEKITRPVESLPERLRAMSDKLIAAAKR